MTDKEIENFVNWLQSCTAKKFYSTDAEDLIFEFKNQALSLHDVIKNEVSVCDDDTCIYGTCSEADYMVCIDGCVNKQTIL